MAMTNTERQRRYRQTRATAHQGEGEKRLNTWISTKAHLALKRLSAFEDAPQRTIIERLLLQADQANLDALGSNEDEFDTYLRRGRL